MNSTVQHVPTITNATARAIVNAAIEAAEQTDQKFTVAVVDAAGHMSAFARMDGTALLTIQIAQDKAYAAAVSGMPTNQWHEFIKDDAPLTMGAPTGIDRLVPFGGGIPINIDGHTVGGIGVSGGHWSDDIKIAEAGISFVCTPPMARSTEKDLFSVLGRVVVLVADTDAALAFYRGVLGFTVLHDQTTGDYRYLHLGLPGQEPVGLWLMTATTDRERELIGRQCGGQPLLVLYTADLDQVSEQLRDHGVRVWNEREDSDSRSLHFADLHGNVIIAAQLTGPSA